MADGGAARRSAGGAGPRRAILTRSGGGSTPRGDKWAAARAHAVVAARQHRHATSGWRAASPAMVRGKGLAPPDSRRGAAGSARAERSWRQRTWRRRERGGGCGGGRGRWRRATRVCFFFINFFRGFFLFACGQLKRRCKSIIRRRKKGRIILFVR